MNQVWWRVLDLPSGLVVEDIGDVSPGYVVISGLRDGASYAATVGPVPGWTEIAIPPEVAVNGSARQVRISEFGVLGVSGATGLWGHTLHPYASVDPGSGSRQGDQLKVLEVPHDDNGAAPARVWVTAGDEELRVTAAYPLAGGHEIRPLAIDTLQLMPVEERLVTAAPLSRIHVAAFAGRITAAGPITGPDALSVWWARSYVPGPGDRPDPVPWLQNPFKGAPSLITDGIDWGAMSFYAGVTTDGTVALWDAEGDLREITETAVDPEHPVALLAELEGWGSYGEGDEPGGLASFAVMTPHANVLLFQGKEFKMPAGRIRSVVLNRGYDFPQCFALIDDAVHVAQLDYDF